MEKKDMLCILKILSQIGLTILLVISSFINQSLADNSDQDWAEGLATNAQNISIEAIEKIMNQPDFDQTLREDVLKPRPALQIFVSSSLPKQLLKAYAKEAKLYSGTLVFRGLPGGSIHKLSDLAMEISDEDSAPMQIDDEAFAAFKVRVVPAIVLSKSAPIFSGKTGSDKFDKVTGALTIKASLELFGKSGDMREEAGNLLKGSK